MGQALLAGIDSPQAAEAGITSSYASFSGSVAQALRPYPQYTNIRDMYQPTGYTFYNFLQIRMEKRYSGGLSLLGAYTLAENLGTTGGDTFGDTPGAGALRGTDSLNRKIEKAPVQFDQTHVFVFSWCYELPFGKGQKIPYKRRAGGECNPGQVADQFD